MADLNDINAAQSVKIVGSDSTGVEQTPVESINGRLKVQNVPSIVSTLNSTYSVLLADATFTGTWEECLGYSTVTITVFTSHESAINGLKYQTSTDGTNWDDGDNFSILPMSPGGAKVYSFGVTSQYFRVIYVNGSTTQTEFRLQTILHANALKNSSHRIDDAITDEDDAELVKSVITGKSSISGSYKNVATDDEGRLLISGQSEILSPLPSVKIVERRVLTTGSVYAFTQAISQNTAIKEFTYGGRGSGEGMFGIYDGSVSEVVPGGNFNSTSDVALWSSTGTEILLGGTPSYSTLQAYEGTGSVALQFDDSDANHTVEISYNWSTPISLDSWRYVNTKFYNNVPAGGTTTRTISIVLTDNLSNKRFYSLSGLTSASPFNANQWIDLIGELRSPTSQTGSTFDLNNVSQISLRMVDLNNKSGTIHWDAVKFFGEIDILQKIYTNGNTIPLQFDPIILVTAGQVIYAALRNNDTTSKEFQLTIAGVDVT